MCARHASDEAEVVELIMHEDIIRSLAKRLYDQNVMDNRERGDYAEELVARKILPDWRWVGMGWHPWDFERGKGVDRLRMQVRQSAAKQIWKRPQKYVPAFPTKSRPVSSYIKKNSPELIIENAGRFCEIYVFAWHARDGDDCDQRVPDQWVFYVLPEKSLGPRKSIRVRELQSPWLKSNGGLVATWNDLRSAVDEVAASLCSASR